MDELIDLVYEEQVKNEFGGYDVVESKRDVWANIRSVTRQEIANAGSRGLMPEMMLRTPAVNYEGESIAVVRGRRYGIYRVYYIPDSDMMELYLATKTGV